MADEGTYITSVVMTALTVITFFVIILTFLYMIWGKEEPAQAEARSKD